MKAVVALIKAVLGFYYAIVYPVRFEGMDNIPAEGGFILCSNHVAARDPIIFVIHIARNVCFMAKKELFKSKIVGKVLEAAGAFPVNRGNADMNAMRKSMQVLKDGDCLGIFPQGTRSKDNERTEMHGGIALIAQRSGANVIPAFIEGPYRPFRRTRIVIGKKVELGEFGKHTDSETISKITGKIDEAIWSMKN